MNKHRWLMVIMAVVFCRAASAEVMVFAAASLADAMTEIGDKYQQLTGEKVSRNFAGSSTLARQIEAGAPADIFISADEAQMDTLESKGLIRTETRNDLLANSLVIVVEKDRSLPITSAADLRSPEITRIALADPASVPAGVYAKKYLEGLGLWAELEPKVVPVENVRAALAAVASGNISAGFVYKTDAAISDKVRVAFEVPAENGPAIRYPVAVMQEARYADEAMAFLEYLLSPAAGSVFEKHGFVVLTGGGNVR